VNTVRVERSGPIARIALNRPERHNAQTPRMWEELRKAGAELASDADVRAVVLTSRGPSFSSGLDLAELQPGGFMDTVATAQDGVALIREAQSAFGWIREAPFPVVAAVRGVAFGAGLQLALACDVRFVAEDATLAMSEVGLGVLPDLGATVDLPALVGTERALDLILTARQVSGAEAVALGLGLRAVPAERVEAEAIAYAHRLATAPRTTLAYAKAATRERDPDRSLDLVARGQVECIRVMLGH